MPTPASIPTNGALDVDRGDGGAQTIRRFAEDGIQDAVDRALANLIKDGKNVAVIAVANRDKFGTAIVARIGDDWSIMAVAEKPWKGDYMLHASVKWSV